MVLWLSKLQLSSFDYQKKTQLEWASSFETLGTFFERFGPISCVAQNIPFIPNSHGSVKNIGPSNSISLSDTAIFCFDDCSTEDDYNWILTAEILIIEYSPSNLPSIPVISFLLRWLDCGRKIFIIQPDQLGKIHYDSTSLNLNFWGTFWLPYNSPPNWKWNSQRTMSLPSCTPCTTRGPVSGLHGPT